MDSFKWQNRWMHYEPQQQFAFRRPTCPAIRCHFQQYWNHVVAKVLLGFFFSVHMTFECTCHQPKIEPTVKCWQDERNINSRQSRPFSLGRCSFVAVCHQFGCELCWFCYCFLLCQLFSSLIVFFIHSMRTQLLCLAAICVSVCISLRCENSLRVIFSVIWSVYCLFFFLSLCLFHSTSFTDNMLYIWEPNTYSGKL